MTYETWYEEDRYSLRAANSTKVTASLKYFTYRCMAAVELQFGEPIIRFDFPIWSTCATAQPTAKLCASHFALSFFLYQFQLAIDFVTGSEEFFLSPPRII